MVELILDRKCYQLLKLEMEFKMLNMIYKHCACARIQKRQHLKAKEKDQIHQKKMPMPELHTVPALSRLCGIFSMSINLAQYVVLSVHPPVCPHVPVSFKEIYAKGNIPN